MSRRTRRTTHRVPAGPPVVPGAGSPPALPAARSQHSRTPTLEVLLRILRDLDAGSTELMCHPARVDRELRESSTYTEERERELDVLTHPDAVRAVRDEGLRLAHFGVLEMGSRGR